MHVLYAWPLSYTTFGRFRKIGGSGRHVTFEVWTIFHLFGVSCIIISRIFWAFGGTRTQVTRTTGSAPGTLTSSTATAPAEMARINIGLTSPHQTPGFFMFWPKRQMRLDFFAWKLKCPSDEKNNLPPSLSLEWWHVQLVEQDDVLRTKFDVGTLAKPCKPQARLEASSRNAWKKAHQAAVVWNLDSTLFY